MAISKNKTMSTNDKITTSFAGIAIVAYVIMVLFIYNYKKLQLMTENNYEQVIVEGKRYKVWHKLWQKETPCKCDIVGSGSDK